MCLDCFSPISLKIRNPKGLPEINQKLTKKQLRKERPVEETKII